MDSRLFLEFFTTFWQETMYHSTEERFVRPFWWRRVQEEAVSSDEVYRNEAVGTARYTSGLRSASKLPIFIDIWLFLGLYFTLLLQSVCLQPYDVTNYTIGLGQGFTRLTSTWPHLRCDVGLEEWVYRENCLCLAVLCTIIMVHKDTSSSYRSVNCIGLWSYLV